MKVPKLDTQFHNRDLGFVKAREDILKDIQRITLHTVGPLCELITKVSEGQIITQEKIVEYASATRVLLGSVSTKLLLARRKNAIKAVNPALVSEVESLPHEEQTNFVYFADNLKSLIDTQRDRSTLQKLSADRTGKRQRIVHKPYYSSRENPSFKPNQFFRKGPTGDAGFGRADQRKSRAPYPKRPYIGNTSGNYRHKFP